MTRTGLSRRRLIEWAGLVASFVFQRPAWSRPASSRRERIGERIEGMLLGSLIGDAAGGPVEFRDPAEVTQWLPAARLWPPIQRLTPQCIEQIESSFRLLPYAELRPDPAPYAHWTPNAQPGTITDDSRHKIPLIDALRQAHLRGSLPISCRDLARAYIDFSNSKCIQSRPHYRAMCEEGLKEYLLAARWVLGQRDPKLAAPPQRLWAGVATNAGQMALLPLSAALAGDPEAAYRAAYALGFMDNGPAKDINCAIVAGLSAAIGDTAGNDPWRAIRQAMKSVDPYGYQRIPFVKRPVSAWLDIASSIVKRADARPAKLYELLETDGRPKYYWDAHFVLVCTFAILEFCNYRPLCSLQLAMDFGHDTDSTAQLVGAFVGAVHGPAVFPELARNQVRRRLRADYDEDLSEWVSLLTSLSDRERYPDIASAETTDP